MFELRLEPLDIRGMSMVAQPHTFSFSFSHELHYLLHVNELTHLFSLLILFKRNYIRLSYPIREFL